MILPEPVPVLLRDARLPVLADSFRRFTGKALVPDHGDLMQALWLSPVAIVAHGTQADPVFFFGNRTALTLFETAPADFTAMPSRLSAEPGLRAERAQLMARVARDGFISDYAGIRISATGKRFRIERAIVWNLLDAAGVLHGQAAAFAEWTPISDGVNIPAGS
jgi:hypothetical protein